VRKRKRSRFVTRGGYSWANKARKQRRRP
jgi:hypothetical protein